jgi:hypothetical protein
MTIAAKEFSNTGLWRGVYFDGPQSGQNHDGDKIPVWFVYVGDEDAEPAIANSPLHSESQSSWRHYRASSR